jgi:hypothetical protein
VEILDLSWNKITIIKGFFPDKVELKSLIANEMIMQPLCLNIVGNPIEDC